MSRDSESHHPTQTAGGRNRREFLAWTGAATAQLLALGLLRPQTAQARIGRKIVDEQVWGRIEELSEGVWAVISTPLPARDWTTVSNGGIIAGDDRVVVVESFGSPAGAQWVGEQAQKLTGRWPTDVVITHFHGDHANGMEGFVTNSARPQIWTTEKTHALIDESDAARNIESTQLRQEMLDQGKSLPQTEVTEVDLGDRVITIHSRAGHTPSDVTIELSDPHVSFCGDLVWNGLFPNYRDAIPTVLASSLHELRRGTETLYVPGHGDISSLSDVDLLIDLVDDIGDTAQKAHAKGIPAKEAASAYTLPAATESWMLFNESYFEVAIEAWYRELG